MKPKKHTPESAVSFFLEKLGEADASGSEIDRSADRLLRRLEIEFEKGEAIRTNPWRPSRYWLRWTSFATAVVVLVALVMVFRLESPKAIATVESGSVESAGAGQSIKPDTMLRAGANGAVVVLADASRVELSPTTIFSVVHSADGIELHLAEGTGIVNAAKQHTGHLYVRTMDCLVSVTGTVFAVRSEPAGSRVSVLEGEVRVENGKAVHTLHRGDQIATSPVLGSLAIEQEIRWSRRAPELVELLRGAAQVLETRATVQSGVISGHIRNTDGSPAVKVRVALAHPDTPDALMHIVETDSDGAFQVADISPGRYVIVAGTIENPTYYRATSELKDARVISIAAGSIVSGVDFSIATSSLSIDRAPSESVAGQFAAGVAAYQQQVRDASSERLLIERGLLTLPAGWIKGRILVDGEHKWPDPRFWITLEYPGRTASSTPGATASESGTFLYKVSVPGNTLSQVEVRMGITGSYGTALPDDYYLKSISSGADDLLKKPLKMDAPIPEVIIKVGVGQRIDGNVRQVDGRRPAANATVTLVPREEADRDRLTRTAITNQNGDFTLRGVAPGDYVLGGGYFVYIGPERVPSMNLILGADQTLTLAQ